MSMATGEAMVLVGDETVLDEVSLWRGRYIEEFAGAETLVSESLASLSERAVSGVSSLLPHLVGQRFEALRAVVGPGGGLGLIGSRVSVALDAFQDHHRYRTFMCHGQSEVTRPPDDRWRLTMRMTTFKAGRIERASIDINCAEATDRLAHLRAARSRLEGQIRGLLASFG